MALEIDSTFRSELNIHVKVGIKFARISQFEARFEGSSGIEIRRTKTTS